ncbi:MAG: CDP-alcohol phosphatidyltransferase family protein [Candidatus Magasanikbacteria bacterium]|nr:CDP-alcohol phosphatidyltransferase family protein [Candidatus Magasanikbacteria bacterium]
MDQVLKSASAAVRPFSGQLMARVKALNARLDEKVGPWKLWAYIRPNWVSLSRVVLAVPIAFIAASGRVWEAFALFAVASLTDWFDGRLAHWRKVYHNCGDDEVIGAAVDALCDKGLIITVLALLPLSAARFQEVSTLGLVMSIIALPLALGVVALEILLTVVRVQDLIRAKAGHSSISLKAPGSGKIKMLAETCGVGALVLAMPELHGFFVILAALFFAVALLFGLASLWHKIKLRRAARRRARF